MNYPTTIPDAYKTHADLESAYREGWNHGHGNACWCVPSLGDRIAPEVDYDGLGPTVDESNIRRYHELLTFHRSAETRPEYPEMSEEKEGPTADECMEAFSAGETDSIFEDLSGYDDACYGIEPENETEEEESEILLPENIVADFEGRAAAERAGGGSIEINHRIPTVAVKLSDGSEFFFQEREAGELIDSTPANISAEDYILALAQGW